MKIRSRVKRLKPFLGVKRLMFVDVHGLGVLSS